MVIGGGLLQELLMTMIMLAAFAMSAPMAFWIGTVVAIATACARFVS